MFYVVYIFIYGNIMKPQFLLSRNAMYCSICESNMEVFFFLFSTFNNPTVRNFSGI